LGSLASVSLDMAMDAKPASFLRGCLACIKGMSNSFA
jgi:hypothetical protein